MPTLSQRCEPNFSPTIRARGRDYAAEGRVRLGTPREAVVDARVAGSRAVAYHVHLDGTGA